jgi:phage protein U
MTMMALGQFVFGMDTLAYQELQRSTDWRHPSNSRVGARPARQFVGPGEDSITLTGLLVPEFRGSRKTMDQVRAMADAGRAYALVAGTGDVLGAWVITRVQESGSIFVAEGVARRVDFTIELARVDDDQADPAGGATSGSDPWTDDTDWWDWWL